MVQQRFTEDQRLRVESELVTGASDAIVSPTNPLSVDQVAATSSVFTQVASLAVDTTILAANANREGFIITNTDTNTLYLLLAVGTATTAAFSVSIPANGYYESETNYTGGIKGIWAADGTGFANVTEFVK